MQRAAIDNLFEQFFNWRCELSRELYLLRGWLAEHKLTGAGLDDKIAHLLQKLEDERITVAIVAEFSRGKTELINAMFFADHGRRLLPSGAGATTMCPTEVLYEATIPPGLRLLPIESFDMPGRVHELKQDWTGWTVIDFDVASPDSISNACLRLSETQMVPAATAERYGLYDPQSGDGALVQDGRIEVPRWRHALFNFPHPVLKQGLVILDTPGLNAIGTEPELTLSTIPSAHVVLFVLGADTGVTRSDRAIWVDHITTAGIARANCLVALNKIDAMWDDLRPAESIDADIEKQVARTAQVLDVAAERIFPVSAQKGLIARIQGNQALLDRSGIVALESALAGELPLAHQNVVQHAFKAEVTELLARVQANLDGRQQNLARQQEQLVVLQGQNCEFVSVSADEAARIKETFERVSDRFNRLQAIIGKQGSALLSTIDPDRLHTQIAATREKMLASLFSKGVVDAMKAFFKDARRNIVAARKQSEEVYGLVEAIYQRFIEEHDFRQPVPGRLALENHALRLAWLEERLDQRFGTLLRVLTSAKSGYTKKYFDSLAGSVLEIHLACYRDAALWLKGLMRPLEKEVRLRREWLAQREGELAQAAQSGNAFAADAIDLERDVAHLATQQERFGEYRLRLQKLLPEDDNWWAQGEAA